MNVRRNIPLSHSFKVSVEGFDTEMGFQQVSGLSSKMEFETINEGGRNDFAYRVPVKTTFNDVTLKRGLLTGSSLVWGWFSNALDRFIFIPKLVTIELCDPADTKSILGLWQLKGAVPKSWELSEFNAQENAMTIETLVLSFNKFDL